MRADAAEADRRQAVREAAAGWLRAGAIDEETRARIDAAYPDDRHRLSRSIRVLLGFFTFVALQAAFGLVMLLMPGSPGPDAVGTLMLLYGLALAAVTEFQIGPGRRRQGGTEAATAFLALIFIIGGFALLSDGSLHATLAVATVVLAAAAWRWGYPLAAAASAGCILFLLARTPMGRALWALGGLVALPLFAAGGSVALPPSLRAAVRAAAGVLLLGAYAALHIGSWDQGAIEDMAAGATHGAAPPLALRPLAMAATALLPLAVALFGVRRRDPALIRVGALLVLASAVTLRFYVSVAPLWVVLIASGTVIILAVLALRRWLHSGPGRERGGFTVEPLFEDEERRSLIEVAAKAAVFTPQAAAAPEWQLRPGGGQFGGGGATGQY